MTGKDLIDVIKVCGMEKCEVQVEKDNVPLKLTGLDIGGEKIILTVEE